MSDSEITMRESALNERLRDAWDGRPAAPIYCFRDTARGWTAVILADDTRYYGRTPGQAADHARVDLDWRAITADLGQPFPPAGPG